MKITVLNQSTEEIEVSLPIYRRHDIDVGCCHPITTVFMRTEERFGRLTHTSITIDENKVELEVLTPFHFNLQSSRAYNLGEGEYKSSKAEFDEAVVEFRKFVAAAEL